jgi:hypothetical protein
VPSSAQIDLQTHVFGGWKLILYLVYWKALTELEISNIPQSAQINLQTHTFVAEN